MRSEAEVRKLNLIEVLLEDAEAEGNAIDEPPADAVEKWSEEDIREYFRSGGAHRPENANAAQGFDWAGLSEEQYLRWFPRSKGPNESGPVVLCFHNAGSAEDMYTSEGTGSRKMKSPLLEWCRSNGWECLAPQLPGRNNRRDEPRETDATAVARQILHVVARRLQANPYTVVAHSMGTWVAYEFLILARAAGLQMPLQLFISGMPSPDVPFTQRPWRQQKHLNAVEFKDECRCWDINEVVFSEGMWSTYEPLLRSDFTIFDEYEWRHAGESALDIPMTCFWGKQDKRVTEKMVKGWKELSSGSFECLEVDGNHLWPLDKEAKVAWLSMIVARLQN